MSKPSYHDLEQRIAELEATVHQQQAEGSAYKRYQELVQHAPVCIHEINADGLLVKMNPAGLAMLGMQDEVEIINTPYLDFVGDANLGRIQGLMQHALEGNKASHFQFSVDTPEGIKTFESNFVPMTDNRGQVLKLMGVTRDITLEHKSETHLLRAKQQAEESNTAKSEFLANISHELRTPINGILGASQLLNDEQLLQGQSELVNIIYSSSNILIDMINSLLDISSLEIGRERLHLKPVNLPKLITSIFNLFKINSDKKSLDYQLTGLDKIPQHVITDSLQLTRIIQNIIANAIKFTDQGHILINLNMTTKDKQQLLNIKISDSGLGIPKNQQENIFNPFTQLDMGISKRQQGAGLGLAICKELCELMQGSLTLESQPGVGTSFTVELPVEQTERNKPKLSLERSFQKNILLVEDNIINQKITSAILAKLGLNITLANNGQEALDICEQRCFDLILMDIQMPIMDGLTASEYLRSNPGTEQVPIIALTASAIYQEQLKCTDAGMSGFLTKPVRLQQLIQELDSWF